jgi:hypothetical protein
VVGWGCVDASRIEAARVATEVEPGAEVGQRDELVPGRRARIVGRAGGRSVVASPGYQAEREDEQESGAAASRRRPPGSNVP